MPVLIDPPGGGNYGFPKEVPSDIDSKAFWARLSEWLVENGYPAEMLEPFGAEKYTRIIGNFDDDETGEKMRASYDPNERIREKQRAREQDDADLASGRVSAAELSARNNFFAGFDIRNAEIELRKALK